MENKTYTIAIDNGREGYAKNTLRAEINLGLKQGYNGFAQEKIEVLNFLTDRYKSEISKGHNFMPFIISESIITYAFPTDDGPVAAHEPALSLVRDKSPLYSADETEEEWKDIIEDYAQDLAQRFQQSRVYVTFSRVEVKIFQQV